MPWDQIFQVGRFVFVSDDTGWWKWVRIALLGGVILFLLWLWLLKDTIEPIEHGMRQRFGVIKFDYKDGLEDMPWLRPKWIQLWHKEKLVIWLNAKLNKRRNRRAAKRLRNSPDGNKPHKLLELGTPRIYGPGWYTVGPKEKGVKIIKLDTRNRVVDLTLYVRMEGGYEVYVLPIQLTVRIKDLYLWMQSCNNTEGGILGVVREKSRAILKLGYETIRDDAEAVSESLMEAMQGKVEWYGGETVFVNPAAPEHQPVSMVAEALRKSSPFAAAELKARGKAITAAISIADDPSSARQ
ncbi:MAG: hypothetical protein JWN75_88 [Candidatus Saccharibacteria bacterium]|nr:hypothetical protein [Candidatus Saccharibacteria bacterium]